MEILTQNDDRKYLCFRIFISIRLYFIEYFRQQRSDGTTPLYEAELDTNLEHQNWPHNFKKWIIRYNKINHTLKTKWNRRSKTETTPLIINPQRPTTTIPDQSSNTDNRQTILPITPTNDHKHPRTRPTTKIPTTDDNNKQLTTKD